jgi:hypothetical protein
MPLVLCEDARGKNDTSLQEITREKQKRFRDQFCRNDRNRKNFREEEKHRVIAREDKGGEKEVA